MVQVDPWSYAYHNIFHCKDLDKGSDAIHACVYYFPGYMAAYAVATVHLYHSLTPSPPNYVDDLRLSALTIWVTRNWSPQQVAAYLAEHQ